MVQWVIVYMNDILIFSMDLNDHHKQTKWILELLEENHLFLKPSKCTFDAEEVKYLGMIIKHGSVAKVKGISNWPRPDSVTKVRSFLGTCNFYRNFIPSYSDIC